MVTLGLPGLLLPATSYGVWSLVGCLSPSRGPGLCSGVPDLKPMVKRGWELTVITPGEMVDFVGGGEAVEMEERERERGERGGGEREMINICHSLIMSCNIHC